jgi:tetratricopeptide (TPR) repeat protein
VASELPVDEARLARLCGYAVMIPGRARGLMSTQPSESEVAPYLELGLRHAGDDDSEARVLLLAAQGFWSFGFGIDLSDEEGERAGRAAEAALQMARRLGRADLELLALDAHAARLNARGLYGHAKPYNQARLEIARRIHDPFEVTDTFYTAAWAALEVGSYRDVLALAAEYQAIGMDVPPLGTLGLSVLARVSLGEWDEALAAQARFRSLLGDRAGLPPSFATGGYGAEVLIHEARGERPAADAVVAEIVEWRERTAGQRPWPLPLAAVALARRGDYATARELLELIAEDRSSRPRGLAARCEVVAEEGTWDEADAVVAATRAHAEAGKLVALPLHADRLEGRAHLAGGDPARALGPLERAVKGFAQLDARWEVALTELVRGEALAALGRDDEAAPVLERAAREFERLRVPRELERAEALLGASTAA